MAKKKTGKIPTLMKHLTSQCKDTKIKKTEFQSDNDANKKIKLGDMKETKLEVGGYLSPMSKEPSPEKKKNLS